MLVVDLVSWVDSKARGIIAKALRCKLTYGQIASISEKLNKIQVRRIAVEVTESHFLISDMMGMVRDYGQRINAIEE